MSRGSAGPAAAPAGAAGGEAPVLVGVTAAEAAVRTGLERADAWHVPALVVCVGDASVDDDVFLRDLVDRWTEKYAAVPVSIKVRRAVDAAVTLAATARSCRLVVLPKSVDPAAAAVIKAVRRRCGCPVRLVDEPAHERRHLAAEGR